MIHRTYRIWDVPNNRYIENNNDIDISQIFSTTIDNGILLINHNEEYVLESYVCEIPESDDKLFEGDCIITYDLFGEQISYYTITNIKGMWYCNNKDEDVLLSDIITTYTMKKIGSVKNMNVDGVAVFKNICTECLAQNIIVQPTNTNSFYCDKCGCLY